MLYNEFSSKIINLVKAKELEKENNLFLYKRIENNYIQEKENEIFKFTLLVNTPSNISKIQENQSENTSKFLGVVKSETKKSKENLKIKLGSKLKELEIYKQDIKQVNEVEILLQKLNKNKKLLLISIYEVFVRSFLKTKKKNTLIDYFKSILLNTRLSEMSVKLLTKAKRIMTKISKYRGNCADINNRGVLVKKSELKQIIVEIYLENMIKLINLNNTIYIFYFIINRHILIKFIQFFLYPLY